MLQCDPFNQRTAPASAECCARKATVQIADVLTDKDYPREHPLRKVAELEAFARCYASR